MRLFVSRIKIPDPELKSMEQHYQHAFVEAITLYRGSLIYSRGLKLFGEPLLNLLEDKRGNHRILPQAFYEPKEEQRYSIQAMEIYTIKGVTHLHASGIDSGFSLKLRDDTVTRMAPRPFYTHCSVGANNSFPDDLTFGLSRTAGCQSGVMPDILMPIDFVFYETTQCSKFVVFYKYALRTFDPRENLIEDGDDYIARPLEYVGWLDGTTRAILFYDNRFYLFAGSNRLKIETAPGNPSCEGLKESSRQFKDYQASELLMTFGRKVGSITDRSVAQFIPSRYGQVKGDKVAFEPKLSLIEPVEAVYQLNSDSNNMSTPDRGSTYSPLPTSVPPLWSTTMAPEVNPSNSEGLGNFSKVVIVCIILVAVAVVCGVIYYYLYADSERRGFPAPAVAAGAPRPSSTSKSLHSPSGISGHLTARSSLNAPSKQVSTTATKQSAGVKSVRSPISPAPQGLAKVAKSANPAKSTKSDKSPSRSPASGSPRSAKTLKSSKSFGSPKSPKTKTKSRRSLNSPAGSPLRRSKSVKSRSPSVKT